jgi:phospholipase C
VKIGRRDFVRGILGSSGAALLARDLPAPEKSGIEHVVLVMMENRSFDHFLGWLPNARGVQGGLVYVDRDGAPHRTHHLRHDTKGCANADPDHTYQGGREQLNGGSMDGFLRSGANDTFAIGYYRERDRPFLGALARNYTTLDRYFCSILGPTFPNRLFQHAAQTDRLTNTITLSSMPTIWDRLLSAGVSARYYFSNIPFVALWGLKYLPISAHYLQFLHDAAAGTLPAVSFVDPRFTTLRDGRTNDDHPHADIRAGDAFLARTFHAVARGPAWRSTVFIVSYDEWGGFFDHVAPPRAAAPNQVDPDLVGGKALLGFRVPAVIASPWTRGNPFSPRIGRMRFDHTSVLKLIEWRWGLSPLTARDGSADVENLARVFRWNRPEVRLPRLPILRPFRRVDCSALPAPSADAVDNDWERLFESAVADGWPIHE